MTPITKAAVWMFPRGEFQAWKHQCGEETGIESYEVYVQKINDLIEQARKRSIAVVLCEWPVDKMLKTLKNEGLPNTSENRARMLASNGETIGNTLGLKLAPDAVGWAYITGPQEKGAGSLKDVSAALDEAEKL